MLMDDRVSNRQAEAGPLPDLFRREERVENLRLQIIRNTGTVVIDLEDDSLLRRIVPGPHDEDAPAVGRQHRLLGVDDEVEQYLLYLMAVGEDLRQSCRERVDNRDVRDM